MCLHLLLLAQGLITIQTSPAQVDRGDALPLGAQLSSQLLCDLSCC
jgi:hypothetical protein